ncbi:MAG TPA: protein kinase [Bryobacteraceae bacterium]|nr:protein kinase [Bryobacteraceae bacterium]
MSAVPGTQIGRYEIVARVGEGGMGTVYKAVDKRLGRAVAIKMLQSGHSQRFEREAQAIAALNHPHICTLYDVGPDYLVMEYIDGAPIQGPLSPEEAVRLAIQIAGALEEAHSKGIIHRDLKPGNILVQKASVKVLDFGLAKHEHEYVGPDGSTVTQTQNGLIIGTAAYMSPEQAEGLPVDARSDIFSFGLVLYEMLSGHRAFPAAHAVTAMAAIIRDEPAPLETWPALQQIVARCLRKAPAERFQNMSELRAALEHSLGRPEGESGPIVKRQPSIAVLPFANMSGDKDNEYFSDGLAEEIINALTRIAGLKVIARTSAFAFKGKQEDIRRIAEALGVANVLEGSVRRSGSRVRITVQLIAAADGSHLWSERYDRELTDIFAVQDEISQAIADALKLKLAGSDEVPARPTVNPEAHQAYLEGRYYTYQMTVTALARAKECFERAIRLDPSFALPHIELALRAYYQTLFQNVRPRNVIPPALESLNHALRLYPASAEAYVLRGTIHAFYRFDWESAGEDFRRALELNPSLAAAHQRYSNWFLLPTGRMQEALAEAKRGLELDPMNVITRIGEWFVLSAAGHVQEEIECAQSMLKLFPGFWIVCYEAATTGWLRGRYQDAISAIDDGLQADPGNLHLLSVLAAVRGAQGQRPEAERICQQIEETAAREHVQRFDRALAAEGAGDMERTYQLLEEALDEHEPVAIIHILLRRKELASDPRYQALLRKMRLA